MKNRVFYTVDVFAESKYAGNQLAVVLNAASLSTGEMQRIAREINYSETSFIQSNRKHEGGFDVRIFTPNEEVPFAGHPTLGTAFVIQQSIIKKSVKSLILNLKVGQISVELTYRGRTPDLLWMNQIQPTFGETELPCQTVSQMLGVEENQIDNNFPIEEVSTGLPHIIVPMKNLNGVKKARVNKEKYFSFIQNRPAKAVLIFCSETYNKANQINARQFADYYGVAEDPATGSANGCLAAYLVKHRYFGKDAIEDVRVEQGYEIGRPSLLYLRAAARGQEIDVWVGGKVIMVSKGVLL
jgi:trans-2,3-dihydro-3-hydroxyanthranilate isomerase